MIYPDSFRLTFIIAALFLIIVLILLSIFMYKKNNEYKNYIIVPIGVGIFTIIAYIFFLLAGNHKMAVFFDSLFFLGTDWLAMFMFIFSVGYTEIGLKYKKYFLILFSILCGIDSVSLLVNNITYHMFDLVLMTSSYGIDFWGNNFGFFHYLHLALCYVMVLLTCLYLGICFVRAPKIYKSKFLGILIAYIVVIIVNCICYSVNISFDYSVILYGVLAAFICYYSTYTYPNKLLSLTLKTVNDTVSDAILYFDMNGTCIYSNKRAKELFENDGKFETFLAEAYREKCEGYLKTDVKVHMSEDCFKIKGRESYLAVEYRKEYYREQYIGSCIRLMDITDDYVNYRKERYVATHDTFTGILNRVGFFDAVDELIEQKGTFGYVMLTSNIRDFKVINEIFGEKIGDEIILKQAGILKTFSHPGTIYARICDDKFALYTKRELFNEKEFLEYMKLMQKVMDKPLYQLRLVVGIYQPQGRVESAQSMYDKALLATTQITNKYNETFSYYDTILMEKLLNEKTINEDFETAIDSKQIQMYLQPIVNDEGKYCGAEALSRWNHPSRGMLLPIEFIKILEKSGLIFQLDEYIWREAAKELRKWADNGIDNHYISVNVSVKDFFYTDIYKEFTRLIEDYDIRPENLHIEITEAVLMSDFSKALSLAKKLQNTGFVVSVDNFGNDYSSLNMLKDFTADELKIGMNLLQSSAEISRNRIILESVIEMADKLGIHIVAEGVETKEHYELLKKCNCKMFQGNYFMEPKSLSEYEAMLFN